MTKSFTLLYLILLCPALLLQADEPMADQPPVVCKYPVMQAQTLIAQGKSDIAVEEILQPAIDQLRTAQAVDERKYYCSRTGAETLMYLLLATMDLESLDIPISSVPIQPTGKTSAIIVDYNFAAALYLRAYIAISKGDDDAATALLMEALNLSPQSPLFLSELAYIYVKQGRLDEALKIYQEAEGLVDAMTPEDQQVAEKSRAMRMQAYILIEQGKLDEAEVIYDKCLEMNPDDKRSLAQLNYINQLRASENSE